MTTKSQESVNALNEDAIASTSSSSADNGQNPLLRTVTVSTSREEANTAITVLLSLGSDLPQPDQDVTAENAALMPINPVMHVDSGKQTPSTSTVSYTGNEEKKTTVPVHKRFVTVKYKLKRRGCHARKFPCGKCGNSYNTQKGVNNHFKETHPPVKCDYCDHSFSCPASMLKH